MTFTPPPAHLTRPDLQGSFGMSASTHWLATATAQSVLERDGNAFDAAVAAAFVLHVVEPHLNGPGGDMTAIFTTAADPATPVVLVGQGPAPRAATVEHLRAQGLDAVPGAGALAAAVPGAVDAWLLLLRDHGTWELGDVLAHATALARDGHRILAGAAAAITSVAGLFTRHWPTSAQRWMPDGHPPRAGDVVTNPALAATLDRLVAACTALGAGAARAARIDAAREAWSGGFVAAAVERAAAVAHRHSCGTDHAGVITAADMAAFSATYEPATTGVFRGRTVAKTGPWGQGPVLLQALAILDGFDDDHLDPSTELGAHTVLEAVKLAMADREAHYGDGDDVPLAHLLSAEHAAARRALITATASLELRPGAVPGAAAVLPALRTTGAGEALAGVGEPTMAAAATRDGARSDEESVPEGPVPAGEVPGDQASAGEVPGDQASAGEVPGDQASAGEVRSDTCHLDVVDRWGNTISATPSGGWLQSSPTIPELGFCLGTRLQMTWLDPASASSLVPGRRPRTTLTPTLVLQDGRATLALGSPGGDQQDQWQLLFLLRTVVGGYTPQQAIDAPALHSTAFPSSFWPRTWEPGGAVVEDRLGEELITALERRGHRITRAGDWSLGRLSCVTRDPVTGSLGAAATSRGAQGYAAGR